MSRKLSDEQAMKDATNYYRLMLVLGAIAYPLWQPLQTSAVPDAIDPLWSRLMIAALGLGILAAQKLRLLSARNFERLFIAISFILTAHSFNLVRENVLNPQYVGGTLVAVVGIAACMPRIGSLIAYLIYVAALALFACHFNLVVLEHLHFFALISTAVAVLCPALALRIKLTRRLTVTATALDRIVDNAATGIAYLDKQGRFSHVNKRAAETFGLTADALIGKTLYDLTLSEDLDRTGGRLRGLFAGDTKELRFDQRVATSSGQVNWVRLYGNQVTSASGEVEGMIAVVLDVTKEKQLEFILNGQQRLLEMIAGGNSEEDVLRSVCEFVHIHLDGQGCVVLEFDDARTQVKPTASLGVPPSLLGKLDKARTDGLAAVAAAAATTRTLTIALANDDDVRWVRFFDAAAPLGFKAAFAAPVIARSGSVLGTFELYIESPRQPTTFEAKMLGAFAEIIGLTMEKHRNERLIEAQKMKITASAKMASLGEMAAGIAHEINNPMTIVLGRSFLIKKLLASDAASAKDEIIAACNSIEGTVKRVTKIIHGLKTFARSDEGDTKASASVALVISETLAFCGERFRNHGVNLEVAAVPETLKAICRPTQISQVLLNLLNNAFDAVSELSSRWVRVEVMERGSFIELAVVDSGSGIPAEIREKLFQPFFSTKEVGKGTGLGLSISLGIVKEHGGALYVDEACKQTRFVLTLPNAADSDGKAA